MTYFTILFFVIERKALLFDGPEYLNVRTFFLSESCKILANIDLGFQYKFKYEKYHTDQSRLAIQISTIEFWNQLIFFFFNLRHIITYDSPWHI